MIYLYLNKTNISLKGIKFKKWLQNRAIVFSSILKIILLPNEKQAQKFHIQKFLCLCALYFVFSCSRLIHSISRLAGEIKYLNCQTVLLLFQQKLVPKQYSKFHKGTKLVNTKRSLKKFVIIS